MLLPLLLKRDQDRTSEADSIDFEAYLPSRAKNNVLNSRLIMFWTTFSRPFCSKNIQELSDGNAMQIGKKWAALGSEFLSFVASCADIISIKIWLCVSKLIRMEFEKCLNTLDLASWRSQNSFSVLLASQLIPVDTPGVTWPNSLIYETNEMEPT